VITDSKDQKSAEKGQEKGNGRRQRSQERAWHTDGRIYREKVDKREGNRYGKKEKEEEIVRNKKKKIEVKKRK
jgi:hypothetical protein